MATRPEVFVVAGEPSADQHAAMLGEALCRHGDVKLAGVGQSRMREAGFDLLFDSSGWSGIGVVEALKRLPKLVVRMRQLTGHLRRTRPELLVLVDFGAFNVRLARRLRARDGQCILYYFPPRSWSRSANYESLAGLVDRVATPFEWSQVRLREAGVEAQWVGHPVVDRITPAAPEIKRRLRKRLDADPDRVTVGLLPGSRMTEIRCNGPQMLEAARMMVEEIEEVSFLLSRAPSIAEDVLWRQVARWGLEDRTTMVDGVQEIVRAADLVVTSSGTATLEAAAAACPMVIIYRGTLLMALERRLRRPDFDFVGMPNIVAGEEVVPELIDENAHAPKIARAALEMLTDDDRMKAIRDRLRRIRESLGSPGVSDRVATMALEMIQ